MKKILSLLLIPALVCPTCLAAPLLSVPFNESGGWILPSSYESGDTLELSANGESVGMGNECALVTREGEAQASDVLLRREFEEIDDEAVFGIRIYSDTPAARPIIYADKRDGTANRVVAQLQLDYAAASYKIYDNGSPKALEEMGGGTATVYDVAMHVIYTDGKPTARYYANGRELVFPNMINGVRSQDYNSVNQFRIAIPKSAGSPTGKQKIYFDNFRIYMPPTAADAYAEGTPQVDSELTAVYAYDGNGGGDEGNSRFQWYASDTAGEIGEAIRGATAKVFYPNEEQVGKYLSYSVEPANATGVRGKTVYSAQTEAVADAPKTKPAASNVKIVGGNETGDELQGLYSYASPIGSPEGKSVYKWYRGSNSSGTDMTVISEGTDRYTIQKSDKGTYIFFEVTPVDESGNTGSRAISEPFAVSRGKLLEEDFDDGNISGWTATQNASLGRMDAVAAPKGGSGGALLIERTGDGTGGYTIGRSLPQSAEGTVIVKAGICAASSPARFTIYADGLSGTSVLPAAQITLDAESKFAIHNGTANVGFNPSVTYSAQQWYILEMVINTDTGETAYFINGSRAIPATPDATSRNKVENITRIRLDIAQTMVSAYVDFIEVYSVKQPSVSNAAISGSTEAGGVLRVDYDFEPGAGYAMSEMRIQWLSSYLPDSGYEAIENETSETFNVTEESAGKYIKCALTPVDEHGIIGAKTETDAVRINASGIKFANEFGSDSIKAGEEFTARLTVSNFEDTPKDICAILAIYTSDNELAGIDRKLIHAASNETVTLSTVPSKDGEQAKVIVWDSASAMHELCRPFCLK